MFATSGFNDIHLLTGHGHDEIVRSVKAQDFGTDISIHEESTPLGTAGALLSVSANLASTILLVYADTFIEADLRNFDLTHKRSGADATVFVHPSSHPQDSDLVVEVGGLVTHLVSKGAARSGLRNLAAAAIYAFQRESLGAFVTDKTLTDVSRDLLPAMLQAGQRIAAYESVEYVKDIGTPARLSEVEEAIQKGVPTKRSNSTARSAIFLDRDGTITKEIGRITSPQNVRLEETAARALRQINDSGRLAIVITNQPSAARGDCTLEDLWRVQYRCEELLGFEGAFVDRVYLCPHHPDSGFVGEDPSLKTVCSCRKPAPGLIKAATRDLGISIADSWFVGDSSVDIRAAQAAGMRSIVLATGHGGNDGRVPFDSTFEALDIEDAVRFVLKRYDRMQEWIRPYVTRLENVQLCRVTGPSRSGKTQWAHAIADAVRAQGRPVAVITTDSWILPVADRSADLDRRHDLVGLRTTADRLCDPFRQHLSLLVSRYCRDEQVQRPNIQRIEAPPDALVIVEGLVSSRFESAHETIDFWVDAGDGDRWLRHIRGKRAKGSDNAPHEQDWTLAQVDEAATLRRLYERSNWIKLPEITEAVHASS